jgi:hypothetical protein
MRINNKGGLMFEFALLLPLIVGLISFTIDMGRFINLSTTIQDATAVSARSGARLGYAGSTSNYSSCPINPEYSTFSPNTLLSSDDPSYNAFCESFEQIRRVSPGVELISFRIVTPSYSFSGNNDSGYWCNRNTNNNLYVTVAAEANLDFITPGLSSVFKFMNNGITVSAKGVAKCEVAR